MGEESDSGRERGGSGGLVAMAVRTKMWEQIGGRESRKGGVAVVTCAPGDPNTNTGPGAFPWVEGVMMMGGVGGPENIFIQGPSWLLAALYEWLRYKI